MIDRGGEPLNPAPQTESGDMSSEPTQKKRKKRRWPWIVFPILAVLAAVGVVGGIFASEALSVRDDLTAAKTKISTAMTQIKKSDTAGLAKTAADITELTARADKTVDGPLWGLASSLPVVGVNVSAVSETTKATNVLVEQALPTALELLSAIDVKNLKMEGGGFNLQPFREAIPKLPALSAAFVEAKTHIDKIDREAILPFVDENIGQVIDIVNDTSPMIAVAEKFLPDFITLLGGDGPRDYALLFQNNAEIRATGGNPGTSSILHVDNGKIEMREDFDVVAFSALGRGFTGIYSVGDPAKDALVEDDTSLYVQNYTRYPDFADTGRSIQSLWEKATGTSLNGVISIDPVVLSYMLEATGPVSVRGEEEKITADNAVKLLLSDTYERLGGANNGKAADEYFAKAASAIFTKVSSGSWDPMKMIEKLVRGSEEQRIYMWFPDEKMQAMSVDLGRDGAILADNTKAVQTGIYINDASYSKLEYYLHTSMNVTCNAEARTITTSLTMKNTVPHGDLSSYTLGGRNNNWGYDRTTMLLDIMGVAVPGGQLTAIDPATSAREGYDRSSTYNGRDAATRLIALPMGETQTVSFTSSVPADAATPLVTRYSPTTVATPVTYEESCMTMFPGTVTPK